MNRDEVNAILARALRDNLPDIADLIDAEIARGAREQELVDHLDDLTRGARLSITAGAMLAYVHDAFRKAREGGKPC